jgi:cell division inhibitor SepF
MSIVKKFKDLMGIEEIEEEEFEDEISAGGETSDRKGMDSKYGGTRSRGEIKEKLTSMQSRTTSPFKLVVIEPQSFEECPKLVDSLKSRRPVIINLEKIESESARKIFDFMSGATYALNGNVQKVANNIFVFAPENVDITGSNENKGFDFNSSIKDSWR